MVQLVREAWWSVVTSGVCATMVLAVGCGASESPQRQAETPSQTQAQAPAKVSEKPFVSGGNIEMQLGGGSYTIRSSAGTAIRVALEGNVGTATVDVTTTDTQATIAVKDTPSNNFQATIDVPQTANLVIRLAAGDLKVGAISGSKDVESNAGNVEIVTGDATTYASVDASVQAGDISAGAFGESQSGLFRRLTWSGKGKYTLRAKLTAGNLTLRSE